MKKTICGAGAAAVLCITMIAALNIGAFAEEAAEIPEVELISENTK